MGGRKSLRDEVIQANVINLSWRTILDALHSPSISVIEKRNISLEVVKKTCPKEINLKGDALHADIYNIINQVQRDIQESRLSSLVLDSGNGVDE
ncbi:MAG: hypothetical protein AABY22_07880 [Nanoarchaeota archaeon]